MNQILLKTIFYIILQMYARRRKCFLDLSDL